MAKEMERLIRMANLLVKQQGEVKSVGEDLKEASAKLLRLEREDLPTLMKELGLKEIKLANGSSVRITEDVSASITDKTRDRAIAWLVKNNFGGMIKTFVSVEFERGAHNEATKVRDQLAAEYEGVLLKEDVHSQTLRSFVRERMAAGQKLPMTFFNVFPFSKAVVKRGNE